MRTNRSGFTLIELLIVVVIIGILAAVAIPKFSAAREKAFLASMKSDLKNLATLQDLYHSSNYSYSTVESDLGFTNSDGVSLDIPEASGSGWAASVTHAGYVGHTCAVFQGGATPITPATVEGQITCN